MIRTQDRHDRAFRSRRCQAAAAALAGILAAAVALGVAELAAALIGPNSAPVIAVGETAINLTPIPVKEFAITHFGSHDKEALVAGILVLLAGFAALIGVLAVRRIGYGLAGLAVFAGLGVAAAHPPARGHLIDVMPTLAGVAVASGGAGRAGPGRPGGRSLGGPSRRRRRSPAAERGFVAGGRVWPRAFTWATWSSRP